MKLSAFLCLAAALLLSVTGCRSTAPGTPEDSAPGEGLQESDFSRAAIFVRALELLHTEYVDADRASIDKLFINAMKGMAGELDPYSGYEPPQEYSENEAKRTGEQTGVGIEVTKPEGMPLVVVGVIPGSPADQAGIIPGDRIVEIDDQPVRKLHLDQAVLLARGPEGSTVRFKVTRGGETDPLEIPLRRGKVIRPSVPPDSIRMLPGKIGYLRIESFNLHTPAEVRAALAHLKEQGATALILDLRNNPGGIVSAAVEIAGMFLAPGKTILSIRNRKNNEAQQVHAGGPSADGHDTETPLVLLVNPFTASASEIFAGALKDNGRARLVGMRTYGKGTLLRVVRLPDGGAVRFASGRYVTPSGRVIEGHGLEPDLTVKLPLEALLKLSSQLRRYPGVVAPEKEGALYDSQLEAALSLLAPSPTPRSVESTASPADN